MKRLDIKRQDICNLEADLCICWVFLLLLFSWFVSATCAYICHWNILITVIQYHSILSVGHSQERGNFILGPKVERAEHTKLRTKRTKLTLSLIAQELRCRFRAAFNFETDPIWKQRNGSFPTSLENRQWGSLMKALKLYCDYYLLPWNVLQSQSQPELIWIKQLHEYTRSAYEVNRNQKAQPCATWSATNARRHFGSPCAREATWPAWPRREGNGWTQGWTIVYSLSSSVNSALRLWLCKQCRSPSSPWRSVPSRSHRLHLNGPDGLTGSGMARAK